MDTSRPKSAPPESFRCRSPMYRFTQARERDSFPATNKKDGHKLEDTINKFHTTERMLYRLKERQRTEADMIVNEIPSGLLAMALPTRKIGPVERETVVARVCRPTASYSARVSSIRRINPRDIYVPPKQVVKADYLKVENERFKGKKPLNNMAVHALVRRLSNYDAERRPPDSNRRQIRDVRSCSVASYRWLGIKNC